MDQQLASRYLALFSGYGVGSSELVVHAKNALTARLRNDPGLLRPDGLYFLLVNIDHMVIRPLVGYVPDYPGEQFKPVLELGKFDQRVEICIDIILGALINRPASAHSVIWAIDAKWKEIGLLFDWS